MANKKLKITAIIQARIDSKRFPNKVLKKIGNLSIIEFIIKRLSYCNLIEDVLVAIPTGKENNVLYNYLKSKSIKVFRGSKNNVLKRYYHAARKNKTDIIIRITSDCPLTDHKIVNKMIDKFKNNKTDYLSNINPPSFPDGLDAEVFTFKALQRCYLLAKNRYDLEHVTPFFRNSGKFKIDNYKSKNNFSNLRLTIDQPEDLILVKKIAKKFATKPKFNIDDIIGIYKKDPELFEINKHIKRNEGSETLNSQRLWRKAKKIIPGGNMLLSKRPELFLPGRWPVYFKKAKGCKVWDIDDNCYFDFSFMGVGTNILGYSNNLINDHVNSAIKKSNVSSLNCVEEVKLAEKLIKLHPWSDMVKFARTGGEANSIAVRIARAASGKDKIAFCGYHGWHDWYLSANLSNSKNLNKQLFSNLSINGVPKSLKNTAFPFEFNDFKKLVEITKKHDIGVIKMEVFRNVKPKSDFLKKIRNLATKKNIILIFDECTSGFRENFGGLHLKYGVAPDIAIFGKALGNGHAITAVLGKKEIMQHAQDSFISSTFWTERSGPAAALKTLEIMERKKSWNIISLLGKKIKQGWSSLAKKHQLKIKIFGLSSICSFEIQSPNWLKYKTLISQEMIKKGFLAANSVYVCIDHNEKIIKKYMKNLDNIFKIIKNCEKNNNIDSLLETETCQTGIKRLN